MPIPPAACSWLCYTDSAWTGVFAKSPRSSAFSVFVIVNMKPFSFIGSMDI